MTRKFSLMNVVFGALIAALACCGCGSSTSVIDLGAGGRTADGGTGGRGGPTGGGTGGAPAGGQGGAPATDAGLPGDGGAPVCMNFARCTGAFTCEATCNINGNPGTRACTCGNNNTLNCAACMAGDAGLPPPVVDAGAACPGGGGVRTGQPCTLGTSACSRMFGGGGPQTCTCGANPNGGGGIWTCQ
jgi:hypothetical protein